MVERARGEVWDILEEVIKERPVLLNRAPTLHRLGIQAFMPVLIEGSAIQLHPLVCPAFNADFDGDQMAVHVPLSQMAVREAKDTMLSVHNMLSPASGEPLVAPTLDMVLGCFYLTDVRPNGKGAGKSFLSFDEARLAHEFGHVDLQAEIKVWDPKQKEGWLTTSVGRILFNEVLPAEIEYKNRLMDKGSLKGLTAECYRILGNVGTAKVLDSIKALGFLYAMNSGITIGINDIQVSPRKKDIIDEATKQVKSYEEDFMQGLMTEEERYSHTVSAWTKASDTMEQIVKEEMKSFGGISMMATSGAKGNIAQIKQMAGMRGLMSNPKGRIIDLPIKSSFREGLTALEYFISTHGARKGLADTALRTADSGYLTRRLTDVCQDVIILVEDCGTTEGVWLYAVASDPLVASMEERALGRRAASPIVHPQTGEILVEKDQEIDEASLKKLAGLEIPHIHVRSPLTCQAHRGLCRMCYGRSPATGRLVKMGDAVGIIAAQSIGEPGTQLTMRTFHTGGIAGVDITSGLPRVEEIFEARIPKGAAVLSDIDGALEVKDEPEGRRLRVVSKEEYREDYPLTKGMELLVSDGQEVQAGDTLATPVASKGGKEPAKPIVANVNGLVEIKGKTISVVWADVEEREYMVPASAVLLAKDGDQVKAGDALTAGPLNPHEILRIKGKEEVERYLAVEVQKVYRSQGVTIHDRHIEVVVRQMLRRVQVDTPGDTEYIPGATVDIFDFQAKNAQVLAEGGEPATARPTLLGVTRSSLLTESFLAAASFQETTRVLTEAAAGGAVDHLQGLKENVIIGRLIPARSQTALPPVAEPFGTEGLALPGAESEMLSSAMVEELASRFTNGHDEPTNGQEPKASLLDDDEIDSDSDDDLDDESIDMDEELEEESEEEAEAEDK
jgi:DNA-directed RNA polymerase subunit beta'